MESSSPKTITLCIATKNRFSKLHQAISKIQQAYTRLHHSEDKNLSVSIVIVDSSDHPETHPSTSFNKCSKAQSVSIIYEYAPSLGLDAAYQLAVRNARSEYIWLLSDDDLVLEDALVRLSRLLSANYTELDLLILNSSHVDQFARFELAEKRIKVQHDQLYYWGKTSTAEKLTLFGYLCLVSCIVFKRSRYIAQTPFDNRYKYFTHATNILSAVDSSSTILVTSSPFFQVRQGPPSWIKYYREVYEYSLPTCIKYIANYGEDILELHISYSRRKRFKPWFMHQFRDLVYSSRLPYQTRRILSSIAGTLLYLLYKSNKNEKFALIAYEFLSFGSTFLALIFWRRYYQIGLIDLRHSHRNTGIGKFQKQFPELFRSHCNNDNLFIVSTHRKQIETKALSSAGDLQMLSPNYVLSELFFLPLLQLLLRPLLCIYTANTSPFFLFSKNNYRILHDTIFIERTLYRFFRLSSSYSLRSLFAEIYMTINVIFGDRILHIKTICISNATRQSATRLGISTMALILPTFIATEIRTISDKYNQEPKLFQSILHFASTDPRKETSSALQAYTEYCIHCFQRGQFPLALTLVGTFTRENVMNTISQYSASIYYERVLELIELCGLVSEVTLAGIYNRSKLLLYPSQNEGFGVPICEAWLYSTLPLIIPITSMKEFPSNAVVHINSACIKDIKDAIIKADNIHEDERCEYILNGLLYINGLEKCQSITLGTMSSHI